ncbi:Asp23/Gls24 family envelope stress response protein [Phycicoccus flavus]|uniref:Asp23/Gls24 family envelope stress response protein n=1 Tax=Phycicoccus flavus TaxID=2502783 RepID=UPI000FEBC384|nr:Asp23/Gls24 family envelope stress response protein [Phycicoccus flavus]NHA70138.1 Asp23/Gls24 family envelope stress response protein [Phycicoccus flavus]
MSETRQNPTPTTTGDAVASSSALVTEHGRTVIADTVVAKIAGIAAREVSGVAGLGGGAARAVGAIRERISSGAVDVTQGISVDVGESQAAVDLDIVAEYGVAIADLAGAVRSNVIAAVEQMTGLEVTEVNITVHDVAIEGDTDEDETPERVR